MSFFRNSTVNLLNLHYALRVFAHSGGGAFYAAYLYKSGLPAPQVLAALACIFIGRFIFRPLILPIAVRTGLRPLLVAGVLISALQYLALGVARRAFGRSRRRRSAGRAGDSIPVAPLLRPRRETGGRHRGVSPYLGFRKRSAN
jgi:hypothetical protein